MQTPEKAILVAQMGAAIHHKFVHDKGEPAHCPATAADA
jgi:hypothetical protein